MNLDSLVNWVAGPPAGADGGDDPSLGDASPQVSPTTTSVPPRLLNHADTHEYTQLRVHMHAQQSGATG